MHELDCAADTPVKTWPPSCLGPRCCKNHLCSTCIAQHMHCDIHMIQLQLDLCCHIMHAVHDVAITFRHVIPQSPGNWQWPMLHLGPHCMTMTISIPNCTYSIGSKPCRSDTNPEQIFLRQQTMSSLSTPNGSTPSASGVPVRQHSTQCQP